jgi:hypothetical protein
MAENNSEEPLSRIVLTIVVYLVVGGTALAMALDHGLLNKPAPLTALEFWRPVNLWELCVDLAPLWVLFFGLLIYILNWRQGNNYEPVPEDLHLTREETLYALFGPALEEVLIRWLGFYSLTWGLLFYDELLDGLVHQAMAVLIRVFDWLTFSSLTVYFNHESWAVGGSVIICSLVFAVIHYLITAKKRSLVIFLLVSLYLFWILSNHGMYGAIFAHTMYNFLLIVLLKLLEL